MLARRGLFAGLGALLAAPAIIRTPGLLMPVKAPLIITQDKSLSYDPRFDALVGDAVSVQLPTFPIGSFFVIANTGESMMKVYSNAKEIIQLSPMRGKKFLMTDKGWMPIFDA